jgi:hypothetical protein
MLEFREVVIDLGNLWRATTRSLLRVGDRPAKPVSALILSWTRPNKTNCCGAPSAPTRVSAKRSKVCATPPSKRRSGSPPTARRTLPPRPRRGSRRWSRASTPRSRRSTPSSPSCRRSTARSTTSRRCPLPQHGGAALGQHGGNDGPKRGAGGAARAPRVFPAPRSLARLRHRTRGRAGAPRTPSGRARLEPAWVRAVRDECADLDIAFFMKQIGSNHDGWPTNIRGKGDDMDEWPEDLRLRQFPSGKRAY